MSESGGLPTLERAGPVATIRLHRPAVHNRLEPEDLHALHGLFDQAKADPAIRVLVLTASGKSFSAGFNIGKLNGAQGDDGGDGSFERVCDRLENLAVPTICGLNGGVYGGSTDLALACDFRIGVEGMGLVMPAAKLGLHYYAGGMRRYVARLGLGAAKRLFLGGQKVDTAELLRIGFLDQAVPVAELDAAVAVLAAILAANAPIAVQGMKAALNGIARGEPDLAAIAAGQARSRASADLKEGRAAWLEKRTPRFTGT